MSQKIKKNYYELLDVSPGSTVEEIEEAYKRARKVYSDGSAAIYSLYSTEEREAMIEQISEAYNTLKDPVKKSEYDALRTESGPEYGAYEVDISELRGGNREVFIGTPEIDKVQNIAKLSQPIAIKDFDTMVGEQYRVIYAKLDQISHKNHYKAFAVTSAVKGEGKSITSLNLSYLIATEGKKKTVLVECDLRKPSTVTGFLSKTNGCGLAEVLKGEQELHSAITRVEGTNLYILPSGNSAKRSSELLGSPRVKAVINSLKAEFDYVIIDSPPILPMVDMNIISKVIDGLVVVVRAGKTRKDIVVKAVNSVSGWNVVGIILNGADTELKKYYY